MLDDARKKKSMSKKSFDSSNELDFDALTHHSNARLNVPVTILKGKNPHPLRHVTLAELIQAIRTNEVKQLNESQTLVCAYEQYRKNVELGLPAPRKDYDEKKEALLGFMLGKFSYRVDEKEKCLEYIPCLVFDLDGCPSTYQLFLYQNRLKEFDYVFAVFPSPSGHGLRVLIWTAATYETHRSVYLKILQELCMVLEVTTQKAAGVHWDPTCLNESRFFYYVAVAPKNFYLNLESKVFEYTPIPELKQVAKGAKLPQKKEDSANYTYIDAITEDVKIEFILKSIDMNKPRKLQCFDFGCLCCENNVALNTASRIAQQHFYDSEQKNPEKVIFTQMKDAYKRTQIRYTDESFAGLLYKNFNIKVLNNIEISDIKKSETIQEPKEAIPEKHNKKSIYRIVEKKLRKHFEIRRDAIARDIEIRKVNSKQPFQALEDDGIHNLLRFLADEGCLVSQKTLETSLNSDFAPKYNPIQSYFDSLPAWDGQMDFIKRLCSFVVAKDQEWFERMFTKMLVRSIACGLGTIENKHCFVLFGGQHNGKTKFLRYLCPPILEKYRKENFKTDKDGIIALGQNFLILIDELDRLKKDDCENLKAVFSMDYTKERPPFGRLPHHFQRIANFFATCNKKEFLSDETGNIRWLIMEILEIIHDEGKMNGYQSVNIDIVWAQAYHLLKNGFYFQLTKEDIAYSEAQNDRFKHVYVEKELISQYYAVPTDENRTSSVHQTSANILIHLQKVSSLNNLKLSHVRKALTELGFSEIYLKHKGRGYMINYLNT
jgi:predicted P-loop ATPase